MEERFSGRIHEIGTRRQRWTAIVPEKHTPQDVVSHTYWLNVRREAKPGDIIEVEPIDASWRMELRVMGADEVGQRVIVAPLGFWRLDADLATPDGYDIEFEGTAWRVYRDKHPLRGGFSSKAEAVLWLLADRGLETPPPALPEIAEPASAGYSIGFAPASQKFYVRDNGTRKPADETRFESRDEADVHLRRLQARAA